MNPKLRRTLRAAQGHASRRANQGQQRPINPERYAEPVPDSDTGCRFIAGEDHYACGAKTLPRKPYCALHAAICYRVSIEEEKL